MFKYFNRIEGEDGRAGAAYRKRVHRTIEEIISNDEFSEDALNLYTLANMAKPMNELDIPNYYAISTISDEYEEYLRKRYFDGLTPEEFEKDYELMEEFNEIKKEVEEELYRRKMGMSNSIYDHYFDNEDQKREKKNVRGYNLRRR